jgi:NADH-quinone oxidoreductase subunit J
MAAVVMGGFRVVESTIATGGGTELAQVSNAKELGKLLYTQYLYPLEVAAAILLVAMFAAIALTLRERKDTKTVKSGDQVRVKARDRMVVLKMASTKTAVEPAVATTNVETKV